MQTDAIRPKSWLCRLGLHKHWEWGDDGMAMCRVFSPTCERCGKH